MGFFRRSRAAAPAPTAIFTPAEHLAPGVLLADGSQVFTVAVAEPGDVEMLGLPPVDRSAGRWCGACGRHGSHHTDRHDEFVQVIVQIGVPDVADMIKVKRFPLGTMVEISRETPTDVAAQPLTVGQVRR